MTRPAACERTIDNRSSRSSGRLARLVILAAAWLLLMAGDIAAERPGALGLTIDGPIGPATSDYIERGLSRAAQMNAAFVLLRIDTPGGLETSMRDIVRAILASPVPVVAYVAPAGARAASAGTFITYAAHIAAMAPGTNIGAATPVAIGAPDRPAPGAADKQDAPVKGKDGEAAEQPAGAGDKAVNDAVAFIRSLAQLRGRNIEWAEAAVRRAASLSADDALALGVIDLKAATEADLLRQIDGRTVTAAGGDRKLLAADAIVTPYQPDWRSRFLAVITNPNVAAILMLLGIYGLLFEFYSPGLVGPGVIGGICLLLAMYAFHVLPIDYTGLALILLGIALMAAEAFLPSFGIIGLGGLVAFVLGAVFLLEADVPGFTIMWEVIGSVALILAVVFVLVMTMVLKARRRAVVSGLEQMIGAAGRIIAWQGTEGTVWAHGERWAARASRPMKPGEAVRIVRVEGLTLIVEPAEEGM